MESHLPGALGLPRVGDSLLPAVSVAEWSPSAQGPAHVGPLEAAAPRSSAMTHPWEMRTRLPQELRGTPGAEVKVCLKALMTP